MKRFLVSIMLAGCALSVWALPTAGEVQTEIGNGNYQRAESMMLEVVTAKPESAKAHYLYAEILAHNKRFGQATDEAATAKRLDPAIGFTQPEKFRSFEQLLAREQAAARTASASTQTSTPSARAAAPSVREAPVQRESGMPTWVLVLGAAAVALIAWRLMRPKPNPAMGAAAAPGYANAYGQPVPQPQPGGAGYAPGYAPGYGQPGVPMQGAGRGMLGTGLAVAGGVAAGMFAEKMLEGRHEGGGGNGFASPGSPSSDAFAPGLFGGSPADDPAARELEQRDIDFGTGGNDWDGDAGGGGDSSGGSDGW